MLLGWDPGSLRMLEGWEGGKSQKLLAPKVVKTSKKWEYWGKNGNIGGKPGIGSCSLGIPDP